MSETVQKVVIILRGASGSGKSSFAKQLALGYDNAVICEADQYFMNNGKYVFDATQLGAAHAFCRKTFESAMENDDCDAVIVSNTNTTRKEFAFYEKYAQDASSKIFFIVVENRHGNKDIHGVPQEIRETQVARIKNSLKLI